MPLTLHACDLDEANAFIDRHHRHHQPVQGYIFALAAWDETEVCRGVAVIGRPVAGALQDGLTFELTRLCTDGTKNVPSFLLGAATRAAFALGYKRLITYTLTSESGNSLRAAGWKLVAKTKGGSWDRRARPRIDKHPTEPKFRWEAPIHG